MKLRSKLLIAVAVFVCLLSSSVILTVKLIRSFRDSPVIPQNDEAVKSDAELIRNFQNHRSLFEQLLEMIQADQGLYRVDASWTDPQDTQTVGVSAQRISEYRRLCRDAEIPRCISANRVMDTMEFIAVANGTAMHSTTKSYVYAKEAPGALVHDLDDYARHSNMLFLVYRHIEGNWYLSLNIG